MIATSKDEVEAFTPASLTNLVPVPVFRFRPQTPRDKRRYTHMLTAEGLRLFPEEIVQAEAIRAMKVLWEGDDAQLANNIARLKSYWETVKQSVTDSSVMIDEAEADAVSEALLKISDAWPQLRRMTADNTRFHEDAPKMALAMYLCGWSKFDVPFKLEDGVVPIETMDALEKQLERIQVQAIADKVEGVDGTAFQELALKALGLMHLTEDEEKNSESPSPSADDQNGSTTDGSAQSSSSDASAPKSSSPATIPATTRPKKAAK
jgi:hypothetical protein